MSAHIEQSGVLSRSARGYKHEGGWTEDRVEWLRRLWADGLSCSEIASEMGGGLTRNGVIGKVQRLGLSGRGARPAKAKKYVRSDRPKRVQTPKPATKTVMRAVPVTNARGNVTFRMKPKTVLADDKIDRKPLELGPNAVSFFDAQSCHCRWPYGDPRDLETFRFCGEPAIGQSYCCGHARQAKGSGAP